MASNFGFLQPEWPQIYESATKAESFVFPDPGTACIHARRTLELVMQWAFKSDASLHPPYQQNLSALVHEPTFVQVAGQAVQAKARLIVQLGNTAAHASNRAVTTDNALAALRELFHVSFWLARTYARGEKPADTVVFLPMLLPQTSPIPPQTRARLLELEQSLSSKDAQLAELMKRVAGHAELDIELELLRAEVAQAKQRNEQVPDTHDYSEAETRDEFIDLLLHEAGWPLSQPAGARVQGDGHAGVLRCGLCRLRTVGQGRQTARPGRGKAHPQEPALQASSRQSFMPIAWRGCSASAR